MIHVERTGEDPYAFQVRVTKGRGESTHRVTMTEETYQELTDGQATPEQTVEAAFRFLLDREPKESILASFDVTIIGRYFPGYEEKLGTYL